MTDRDRPKIRLKMLINAEAATDAGRCAAFPGRRADEAARLKQEGLFEIAEARRDGMLGDLIYYTITSSGRAARAALSKLFPEIA